MKQIRRNVFETNSSSMHSVVIHKSDTSDMLYPSDRDNYVHTRFDEFGWDYDGEYGPFYDAETKLSYLVTMMAENTGNCPWCENGDIDAIYDELMTENDEFVELNEIIKRRCDCDGVWIDLSEGYIDHQSMYPSVHAFLEDYCLDSMEDFIFDSGIGLIIDNDNR